MIRSMCFKSRGNPSPQPDLRIAAEARFSQTNRQIDCRIDICLPGHSELREAKHKLNFTASRISLFLPLKFLDIHAWRSEYRKTAIIFSKTATMDTLINPKMGAMWTGFQTKGPEHIRVPLKKVLDDLVTTYDASEVLKVGAKLPAFKLPDATGKEQSSGEILSRGPMVVTFFRGEWCPYCNIALSSFQQHLDEFQAKDVTIVAITPQLPNGTVKMTEKHNLAFSLLTDLHNEYARQLGIVWQQPDVMRPITTEFFHHDLKDDNGDDSYELPLPATFLVDKTGTVRNVHFDPNWTVRAEPTKVLEWVNAL